MNTSSGVPPRDDSGLDAAGSSPTDPITLIEQALVTMRRDQERRRLQRRAEHFGQEGHDAHGGEHPHPHEHETGHETGHGHEHPHGHGRRRGPDGPGRHALAHAARFRLLDALEGAERPPSVSELAEAIGVDQPRASRLVQAAVEAGHVRREADPSDARRSALVLTASGRKLLESARDTRRGAVETALAAFTPEETAEFARLLSRFIADWPRDER